MIAGIPLSTFPPLIENSRNVPVQEEGAPAMHVRHCRHQKPRPCRNPCFVRDNHRSGLSFGCCVPPVTEVASFTQQTFDSTGEVVGSSWEVSLLQYTMERSGELGCRLS